MMKLPTLRPGRSLLSLTRREVKAVIDTAKRGDQMSVGTGMERSRTTSGHNIRLSPSVPMLTDAGISVSRFIVVQVNDDDYDCKTWDGTNAGSDTKVKKPYELQRTPWDLKAFDFSVPGGVGQVNLAYEYIDPTSIFRKAHLADGSAIGQTIVPMYQTVDTEQVDHDNNPKTPTVEKITGGSEILAAQDADGDWWDINDAGRAWAELVAVDAGQPL